jgi:plasmid stability protein
VFSPLETLSQVLAPNESEEAEKRDILRKNLRPSQAAGIY